MQSCEVRAYLWCYIFYVVLHGTLVALLISNSPLNSYAVSSVHRTSCMSMDGRCILYKASSRLNSLYDCVFGKP
jgi:hypothetical protein